MQNDDLQEKPLAQETAQTSQELSWTASEFIEHKKNAGWYIILGLISAGLTAVAFIFADIFTAVIVLLSAALFGYIASKKPRELPYLINSEGVRVDKKLYRYSNFKSFSIIQEEGIQSVWFMPMQRFAPGLSIYFSPEEGQKIVNLLGTFIPYEERKLAPIDQLMHRLRF
jgi:hypothetical protein